MSSPEKELRSQVGRVERMEFQNTQRLVLAEDLKAVRAKIARAQSVDDTLRGLFLNALSSVERHLDDIERKETERAPNGTSVIILAALMFLAAEHGGRKAVVRAKDAFAKYFPDVNRDVWLGVQKATNPHSDFFGR